MPRDLIDLMERAASGAPPEPHAAADITRVAARHLRRRTTSLVAGVAAVVVVAGCVGYGVTRRGDTTPQPSGPPGGGLHQTVADAVPASSVAGFTTLDYGVPSVAEHVGPLAPNGVGQYVDVDAAGRLAVMKVTNSPGSATALSASFELVDGPGKQPVSLPAPLGGPSSGLWQLSFTGSGGLAWRSSETQSLDYVLSDAQGAHPVPVTDDLSAVPGGASSVRDVWYDAGRVWFSAVTRATPQSSLRPKEWVSLFSVDPAHPSVVRAEKPVDAQEIDVAGDEALWIRGSTVRSLDLRTGSVRTVPVPRQQGCDLPSASMYVGGSFPGLLATNGRLVSQVQLCGQASHVVVSDLDGRLVTDVSSPSPGYLQQVDLSGDFLTFQGQGSDGKWTPYAMDLTTRRLVRLGPGEAQSVGPPQSDGHYLLWYDADGGHVGRWSD
jgi:hypothetical protein